MIGVTAIDVEVPGDGRSVRGAYLDWMKSSQVMRPMHAEQQNCRSAPFAPRPRCKADEEDAEVYGTVTAPLTAETIPIGSSLQEGGAFQFGLESQPLVALLTFEVASPQIEAPPEIYVTARTSDRPHSSCPIWPIPPIAACRFPSCRRCNSNTPAGSERRRSCRPRS